MNSLSLENVINNTIYAKGLCDWRNSSQKSLSLPGDHGFRKPLKVGAFKTQTSLSAQHFKREENVVVQHSVLFGTAAAGIVLGSMLDCTPRSASAIAYPDLMPEDVLQALEKDGLKETVFSSVSISIPEAPVLKDLDPKTVSSVSKLEEESFPTGLQAGGLTVLGLALVFFLDGFTKESESVEKEEVKMEEFDAKKAAERARDAGAWIQRWQTASDIRRRTAEASVWIEGYRARTRQAEMEARIADRSQWIATWRTITSKKKTGTRVIKRSVNQANPLQQLFERLMRAFKKKPTET